MAARLAEAGLQRAAARGRWGSANADRIDAADAGREQPARRLRRARRSTRSRPRTTRCAGTFSSATMRIRPGRSATRSIGPRSMGKPVNGVLYPRAGTLGGCTAHNAMILIYPHNADWNQLADLTGDSSWRAEKMRAYFERIERATTGRRSAHSAGSARTPAATAGPAGCRPKRRCRARRSAIATSGRRSSSRLVPC